jgi:hypothetical protein
MDDNTNETLHQYQQHLTPELRQLFDAKGYELVHLELLYRSYSAPEKRLAAAAWLAEQRAKHARTEWVWWWIPIVLSTLALGVSFISLFLSWQGN